MESALTAITDVVAAMELPDTVLAAREFVSDSGMVAAAVQSVIPRLMQASVSPATNYSKDAPPAPVMCAWIATKKTTSKCKTILVNVWLTSLSATLPIVASLAVCSFRDVSNAPT